MILAPQDSEKRTSNRASQTSATTFCTRPVLRMPSMSISIMSPARLNSTVSSRSKPANREIALGWGVLSMICLHIAEELTASR